MVAFLLMKGDSMNASVLIRVNPHIGPPLLIVVDADDFRHEIGEFPAAGLQEEEVGKHLLRPRLTGGKGADTRRVGKDIFQGNMALRFLQRQLFPLAPDETDMGLPGGKTAGREILLPEKALLQLSGTMGEEKIMETAAEIPESLAGKGFDGGYEALHRDVLEIGLFKLLEAA